MDSKLKNRLKQYLYAPKKRKREVDTKIFDDIEKSFRDILRDFRL